jgi:hypothetical protein
MKVQEAAEALARLLNEIDHEEISVMTEDCGTIYLMRGSGRGEGFAEVNDHTKNGKWAVE